MGCLGNIRCALVIVRAHLISPNRFVRLALQWMIRVGHAAIHRAHQSALGLIVIAHTFFALLGVNLVGLFPFTDGLVRTLRLTGPTQDALFSDHIRHGAHLLPYDQIEDQPLQIRATAKSYKACPNSASDRYFTTVWRFCQIPLLPEKEY
jgi:hypothetical protein